MQKIKFFFWLIILIILVLLETLYIKLNKNEKIYYTKKTTKKNKIYTY